MKKNAIILILMCLASVIFSQTIQEALVIVPDGKVGVNTLTPTEQLEVNGNIKVTGRMMDKMGIIMPVGTILPFAGDVSDKTKIPEGWLLCDGTAYSKENYPDLWDVIGKNWGDGSKTTVPNSSQINAASVDCNATANHQ